MLEKLQHLKQDLKSGGDVQGYHVLQDVIRYITSKPNELKLAELVIKQQAEIVKLKEDLACLGIPLEASNDNS